MVAAATTVLLSLLLLTGTPDPLPVYPSATAVYPIAGEMYFNGLPLRLKAQDTKDRAREILLFYQDAFERAGLPAAGPEFSKSFMPFPAVSAVDAERKLVYVAMVMTFKEDRTIVTGVADVGRLEAKANQLFGIPLFPGASNVTATRFQMEGGAAFGSFLARATPDEVRAFYRELLPKAGFRVQEKKDGSELVVVRGNEAWSLRVVQDARYRGNTTVFFTNSGAQL
jgi:hypothetical protein